MVDATTTTEVDTTSEEAIAAAATEKMAADAEAARLAAEGKTEDTTKVEDTKVEDKELDTAVWGTTNDEVGDSVMLMLQNSGVDVATAQTLLLEAVTQGKLELVDKDALTKAVGKAQATLILAGAENYINRNNARKSEVEKVLHDTVGGKASWGKITEWAKTALTADELMDYATMVDQGGRKATLAAKDLMERYEEKNGTIEDTTVVPKGNAPKKDEVEGLSRADYFKAMEKLKKGKPDPDAERQLWLRREAGKKQNM